MAITDYTAALKKGKRNYQLALAKGAYPYLPALDDIISFPEGTAYIKPGLMDIPVSFMPLRPQNCECAAKWPSL